MILRWATLNDENHLRELLHKMDLEELAMGCRSEHNGEAYDIKKFIENKNCLFFVAMENNRIIGFGYAVKEKDKIIIQNFFVEKEWRKRGIASQILKRITERWKGTYGAYIFKNNQFALEFWQKRNFAIKRELKNAYYLEKEF